VSSFLQLKTCIFRITALGTWNLMRIRWSEAVLLIIYHWIIIANTLVCTYLLTYSVEQSPSWEAIQFSASQEIPRILGNRKVHYRIHKCPPHPTSWRSIFILSSHLRLDLPSVLFPSGFPTKTLYTTLFSHIRATCPAHLIFLDFITRNILCGK